MLWLKRILFCLVLAVLASAWPVYQKYRATQFSEKAETFSHIAAEAWVASAQYRYEPEMYMTWRDSLLQVRGHTREELEQFLTEYSDEAEEYAQFVELVHKHVDSIVTARGIKAPAVVEEEVLVGNRQVKASDSIK